MKTTAENNLISLCSYLIAVTIVLLPFYAFVTVWGASIFGHYGLIRVWIEIVLFCLAILSVIAFRNDSKLRVEWRHSHLVWAAVLYVVWQLVLGLLALHERWVNRTALLDGLTTDLRFIGFLLIAWAVAMRRPWLAAKWRELLLIPALLVTVFGLLEAFVLSKDVLRHVGYGPNTIAPYETVNQNAHFVRVQSTLRGPNMLGAYTVMTIPALVLVAFGAKLRKYRIELLLFLAATFVILALSYSRSAYIGAVVALGVCIWLSLTSQKLKRAFVIIGVALILLTGGMFVVFRNNSSFQNAFFHTTKQAHVVGSDQVRRSVISQTLRSVIHTPLGRGAGSSGPASVHNNHPANIPEDYYLQIGQEAGWFGLVLFLYICASVFMELWKRHSSMLVKMLLGSFIGLLCVNVLSPAWTDETVGMVWWGLAGIALSLPLDTTKKPARRES